MSRNVFLAVVFTAVFFSSSGLSKSPALSDDSQLETFAKAYELAHKPKNSNYLELAKTLRDHPLYPYLVQKGLLAYPYLANEKVIRSFLQRYENSPLDKPLRKKWLAYLRKKKQYALYNEFYRPMGDAESECLYLNNKLSLGAEFASIKTDVQGLWVVGKSQPKTCDGLFKRLQQGNHITEEMILKRVEKAADGGKHTLLPYLRTLLPPAKQYIVDLWYKVRRSPKALSDVKAFKQRLVEQEKLIVLYGLKRLIWREPDIAIKLWESYQQRYSFTSNEVTTIGETFAIRLSVNGHKKANHWLGKMAPALSSEQVTQWYITDALRNDDWQGIVDLVSTIPNLMNAELHTRYWYGMALVALQRAREAKAVLKDVANQRHYYGFLASHYLQLPVHLSDKPVAVSDAEIQAFETYPALQRARGFYQLDMLPEARREWRYLLSKLSQPQLSIAAVIADQWGWHEQVIATFGAANYSHDVQRRFPLGHKALLLDRSDAAKIDPAWAFAIVRKESAFSTDAYSGAGARGLMQLLPSTARYMAKKKVHANVLYRPEFNIKYGTMYLKYLLDKAENNPVLATAAYNAGWRNVKKWAPEAEQMRFDIWIETIPFKETRNYVKSVIAFHQIYALMLERDNKAKVFTSLPDLFIRRSDFGL